MKSKTTNEATMGLLGRSVYVFGTDAGLDWDEPLFVASYVVDYDGGLIDSSEYAVLVDSINGSRRVWLEIWRDIPSTAIAIQITRKQDGRTSFDVLKHCAPQTAEQLYVLGDIIETYRAGSVLGFGSSGCS